MRLISAGAPSVSASGTFNVVIHNLNNNTFQNVFSGPFNNPNVPLAGPGPGETQVFAADGPDGQRFTLTRPWSLLLLDDARVIHESTPITPEVPAGQAPGGAPAHRDTLVLTFRGGGFQGDDATIPG